MAEAHCCEDMRREVELARVLRYAPAVREYGIVMRDGDFYRIGFCPLCGARLPESLLAAWYEAVTGRGLDPLADDLPAEFRSAAWWAAPDAEPGAAADTAAVIVSGAV